MPSHTGSLNPETDCIVLPLHTDSKLLVHAETKCQGLPFFSNAVELQKQLFLKILIFLEILFSGLFILFFTRKIKDST